MYTYSYLCTYRVHVIAICQLHYNSNHFTFQVAGVSSSRQDTLDAHYLRYIKHQDTSSRRSQLIIYKILEIVIFRHFYLQYQITTGHSLHSPSKSHTSPSTLQSSESQSGSMNSPPPYFHHLVEIAFLSPPPDIPPVSGSFDLDLQFAQMMHILLHRLDRCEDIAAVLAELCSTNIRYELRSSHRFSVGELTNCVSLACFAVPTPNSTSHPFPAAEAAHNAGQANTESRYTEAALRLAPSSSRYSFSNASNWESEKPGKYSFIHSSQLLTADGTKFSPSWVLYTISAYLLLIRLAAVATLNRSVISSPSMTGVQACDRVSP